MSAFGKGETICKRLKNRQKAREIQLLKMAGESLITVAIDREVAVDGKECECQAIATASKADGRLKSTLRHGERGRFGLPKIPEVGGRFFAVIEHCDCPSRCRVEDFGVHQGGKGSVSVGVGDRCARGAADSLERDPHVGDGRLQYGKRSEVPEALQQVRPRATAEQHLAVARCALRGAAGTASDVTPRARRPAFWPVWKKAETMLTHGSDCQRAGPGPCDALVAISLGE
jgi:hypothetical protein